ncbi:hypothetical protein [Paracoccus methylarcula]|uniref:Uncharacterized protein n=1 Tax=Paracoccus methylarcula TaxID=72022 RepID=A0A3R7LLB1_9RHOB|nr:hypothetical protein [Paracoccus methylarcula]RNF35708.1 hypothetical protein A7A09_004765 [Paracoccus methylarcula]
MATLVNWLGWLLALAMIGVTVLLAFNKQSGLKLIQHRVEMLPQAMLVRYAGLTALALIASWIGAPRVLFGLLVAIAVIGLGDTYIYRRAGHPFWLHLAIGGAAAFGAFLSLFAMS